MEWLLDDGLGGLFELGRIFYLFREKLYFVVGVASGSRLSNLFLP